MKSIIKGRFSKWIFVFVAIGLLMQPIQLVLAAEQVAQESLATSGPSAPESTTVELLGPSENGDNEAVGQDEKDVDPIEKDAKEETGSTEESAEKEDELKPEDIEEEETSELGIPEPPAPSEIQLPPSTIKQKTADADVATGALVYSYQLQVPNGRAGIQPSLGLSYNSQQNEEGSLVGYGWGLDIPTIERKNIDGINKMYSQENFTSSMSGDLKKIGTDKSTGLFAAKIDNGGFAKYSFAGASTGGTWTVQDKSGMVYTFGAVADARLSNPNDNTKVFRWHLTRMQDSKGNFVSYEYVKVDNQVYPSIIRYSGNGANAGIFKVQFNLEDRTDKAMSAKYGYMITTTKRLENVETFVSDVRIGRYDLSYGTQSVNNRSQLTDVQYTGYDIAGANGVSDGVVSFEYQSIAATDLLSKITQNTGGETTVSYKSSAQLKDNAGALLNPRLPFAVQTVEKIEYDDRNGVTWENSFQYAGGWFYYNGPMDRRFVGFEKVVRADDVGNTVTTFYHQGNGNNASYGETLDDWAKAGKSYKSELRDAAGNLYTQSLSKWEFNRLAGIGGASDRSFVKLTANVTRTFDGNSTHEDKAATYSYNSANGNLISAIDFGEVDATETGSFSDVGTDKLTTTVSYAEPTVASTNIVGLPSGFIELNFDGAKVKEGKTFYDELAFGQVSVGNATKEQSWIKGSNYATVTRQFNSFGLPVAETDPLGNTSLYGYDEFNLYPVAIENALGHETSYEYDYRIGKPIKTFDPNGLISKITYDGLGRATKEEATKPGQSDSNALFTKKAATYELYEVAGEVHGWKTTEKTYLDEVNATTPREHKVVTYTDGFDRTIQTRVLVESADATPTVARYAVTDTSYNGIAQIAKTSLPYFSNEESRTFATTDASLYATLMYDPVYRVVSTSNAVGTSTNTYDDWKVTVTDAASKIKTLHKDAYDRLEKVDEHNGSETYTTRYSYDAEGNLIKIVDALGNEREFTYDGLGRRTSADDLHASGDKTYGEWSYTYDVAGNLSERTDANGITVGYTYDGLNRVTQENANKDSSVEVTYVYDSCVKGTGRLCSVTNSAVTAAYEYNVLGQTTKETKTINSQAYVSEYTYDRQGNQLTIKNPDSSEVKNAYNIGGALESVQSKESGASSFGNVVVDIDYAPTGSVTYQEMANGSKTTNTFDATKLYRLTSKVGTLSRPEIGLQNVQNISYTYDAVGNITQIADLSDINLRKTVNYTYDDLHRLTFARSSRAAAGQNYVESYSYDAIGNLIYKSDVGTYNYDGDEDEGSYANPHAVTSITTNTSTTAFTYDNNGNTLNDGSDTYVWDYNNRISSITPDGIASNPIVYGYDASGMRVKVVSGATTTVYPSQSYNTSGGVSGAEVQKHIFAGEGVVATIKGSGGSAALFAMHTDHLGSTNVVSDSSGAITETTDYFPFGAVRNNTVVSGGGEQRKFIGQEYDAATELSYLEARYYDGKLGKFLSQDVVHLSMGNPGGIKQITGQELQQFLSDPQSFNSYSYARNNPVNLKDPNGEFWGALSSFVSKVGYATSNFLQKQYQQTSWTSPIKKAILYVAADAFKQQGVALDKSAPAKDRAWAGAALVSNFIAPEAKGVSAGKNAIVLTSERMLKVQRDHTLSGQAVNLGKSYFFDSVDLQKVIKLGNEAVGAVQDNGNVQRILDLGYRVGFDRNTSGATSFMTIITNSANELITAHPGLPEVIKATAKTIKK